MTTTPDSAAQGGVTQGPWTCFHCGDTFTEERCARLHFGATEDSEPACRIKAGAEGSLLRALRSAEMEANSARQAIADECTEAARAYYSQTTRHNQALLAAEELGYERGLADGRASSPPAQQAGVEGGGAVLPAAIVAFLMGEGAYDGVWFGDLNEGLPGAFWWRAIIATARRETAALRPSTDVAAQPTHAGVGERECQAVWRCAVGDVTSALDVLKNQWIGSKRKAERDAGAVLSGVLDLVWAYREPAAANYEQANANGKKLAERVRFRLAATPDSTGREEAK